MFDQLTGLMTLLPILIGVIVVVVIVLFVLPIIRNSMRNRQLMQTGETAQATILRVWETGVRINEQPQIGLQLNVTPATRPAFQAEARMTISFMQAGYYQPGMIVEVKYDPNDTSKVAVSGVTGASAGMMGMGGMMGAGQMMGGNQMQMQQMLTQIDAFNQNLMAIGESAQAKVLSLTPMGVNVNGNNPFVSVRLEVMPSGRPSFQAEAKGVIAEASVPKYQAGSTIWVKFNPMDTSQVTLDHS